MIHVGFGENSLANVERRGGLYEKKKSANCKHSIETYFAQRASTYLDLVPVLAGEGVHGLLLETLLALGQSLVPARESLVSCC